MTSKIKLKLGPVEVEYEGSEDFLKKELPELLSAISKLYKESGIPSSGEDSDSQLLHGKGKPIGTTASIAGKLKVKTASALVTAAAARLIIVSGKQTFTRDELLKEMKTATMYYKKNYSNNLSKTISALIKSGKLIEAASDVYSLEAMTKKELESTLAQKSSS